MLKKYFFSLIPTLFLSFPCFASPLEESLQNPFFLSMSGSGGASLNEDLSYLINPSLLAFHKKKKAGLAYSFKNKNQTALLSFVDNKIKLPLALTYQRRWTDSFLKGGSNKLFLSSGFKLSPFLSLGFNIERNLQSSAALGNAGLGSFVRLNSQFGIALFLDKILKEKDQNLRLLTFSGSYRWKDFFSIHSDLSRSAQKEWVLRAGLESLFHPLFSFQLGGLALMKKLDLTKTEQRRVSAGLSFHSPKFVCSYGLQTDAENYQHSLAFLIKI